MTGHTIINRSNVWTSYGEHPSCIVMWCKGIVYGTHVEVHPKDQPAYLISGHYDMTREQAEIDYASRVDNLKIGRVFVWQSAPVF